MEKDFYVLALLYDQKLTVNIADSPLGSVYSPLGSVDSPLGSVYSPLGSVDSPLV